MSLKQRLTQLEREVGAKAKCSLCGGNGPIDLVTLFDGGPEPPPKCCRECGAMPKTRIIISPISTEATGGQQGRGCNADNPAAG